jgi:hypothetical protein
MIEKHYGSYIKNDARVQLAIARGTITLGDSAQPQQEAVNDDPAPCRVDRATT